MNAKKLLVDNKIPKIINKLQQNNLKNLIITSLKNEKIGKIESTVNWRETELINFGYDFSKQWTKLKAKNLSEDGVYYKSGIIYAKPKDKGEALNLFLKYSKISISKIVLIDDCLKNLIDVQKSAKNLGLDFVGIHFSQDIKRDLEFSQKRSDYQIKYLIKKEVWLSDIDAENKIQS